MTMELSALRWLRFEKNCRVALFERSPRYNCGQPDVLGVTQARYLYEIEIKRSMADFRANAKKSFHNARNLGIGNLAELPKLYWFMVPKKLTLVAALELPTWAGLLALDGHLVVEVTKAPVNDASRRLTTKECVKLACGMANQILSFSSMLASFENYRFEGWIDDYSI